MTQIKVGGISVDVIRKDIKNIHLGVYPPNGKVRVSVPSKVKDATLRLYIISKLSWINKQKLKFSRQERQEKREYVSGESHYFLGKRYRLNVVRSNPIQKVEVRRGYIDLYVKPNASTKNKEGIMDAFYRKELEKQVQVFTKKWEKKTGIEVRKVRIKKMKTRWGTCIPARERIWINLELAKKPLHCLEYILVHEMVHFLERNHSERFIQLMDSFMPSWRQYREELNQSIRGHSEWHY